MIIDCISDTHGNYPILEGGDLLIIAGDITARDTEQEYIKFYIWLHKQNYQHYIFIGGNHDNLLQEREVLSDYLANTSYLCDSGTELAGLKVWGSPWTKTFPGMNPKCKAFTVDTEEELAVKFSLIPDDTDILITHSPPIGIMDDVERHIKGRIENVGSLSLLHKAGSLQNLKLHVFGHIHEGYGKVDMSQLRDLLGKEILEKIAGVQKCKCYPILVNASHVDKNYQPVNKPIRIEL